MKRLLLSCLLLCLGGCATVIKNQGEVGMRWGTEITFFSRAAQTADEPATAEIKVPALAEWIIGEPQPEPEPEPVP